MADEKVSQYPAATTWTGAEILYLIQSALDKHISLTTLFSNIPVLSKFTGKFGFGNRETLTADGAISVTTTVTLLQAGTALTLTLAAGTFDGQIKVLIADATANVTATLGGNYASIALSPGENATLMFVDSKWWLIGGTAVLNS